MVISNIHRVICWANVPFNLVWKKLKKENVIKSGWGRNLKKPQMVGLHNAAFLSPQSASQNPSLSFFIAFSHNNVVVRHHCLYFCLYFSISHCLFYTHRHTHIQYHTPYFISPCVSVLSRDYNVVSHYTLWALCQCSRGLKLPKSSDFCHVGTAQLDNWRWKVQNFTLPPSLSLTFQSVSARHSLSLIPAFKLKCHYGIYFHFLASFCDLWPFWYFPF